MLSPAARATVDIAPASEAKEATADRFPRPEQEDASISPLTEGPLGASRRPGSVSPRIRIITPNEEASVGELSLPSPAPRRGSAQSWKPTAFWQPRRLRKWKAPLLMVIFFLFGVSFSIAHCVLYPSLDGDVVGDSASQEEKLRYGTAFSFLAQLALTSSVWAAYTQWLWHAVLRKRWTVKGLNKAFSADVAPSSLLSREMFRNYTLGTVIGFFAWCLILPPFFTPATLFVYPSTAMVELQEDVPYLAIAHSSAGGKFAYSPPMVKTTTKYVNDTSRLFLGPRTVITLLSTAASRGEILPIRAPYNTSAYSVSFYGPIIQCGRANDSTVPLIDGFLSEFMDTPVGTAHASESGYFAFVPIYGEDGSLSAVYQPRYQQPSNATNEVWMSFLRFVLDDQGLRKKTRLYQVCRLFNATYDLHLQWNHGFQNVSGTYEVGEEIFFPMDKVGDISNMAQHSYAALFWTMADQVVGSFAWFVEENSGPHKPPQYGDINSPIQHNSLLGSSDLDAFFLFDEEHKMYQMDNDTGLSDQRMQDKLLARNRTIPELIEELSFNITVSMLHNDLLAYKTPGTVTRWEDVNRYGYSPWGLFIPYALANLFTLITVILGAFSYVKHPIYPDKKFQDIAYAAAAAIENHKVAMAMRSGDRRPSVTASHKDGVMSFEVRESDG